MVAGNCKSVSLVHGLLCEEESVQEAAYLSDQSFILLEDHVWYLREMEEWVKDQFTVIC